MSHPTTLKALGGARAFSPSLRVHPGPSRASEDGGAARQTPAGRRPSPSNRQLQGCRCRSGGRKAPAPEPVALVRVGAGQIEGEARRGPGVGGGGAGAFTTSGSGFLSGIMVTTPVWVGAGGAILGSLDATKDENEGTNWVLAGVEGGVSFGWAGAAGFRAAITGGELAGFQAYSVGE